MYSISFNFKSQKIKFESETIKKVVGGLIDFLHENGYKFEGIIHNAFTKKPVTLEEINNHSSSKYYLNQFRLFHKIKNSEKYIWIGGNVEPAASFAKKMLINFGIDESTINIKGFTSSNVPGVGLSRIKKFGEIEQDIDQIDEPVEPTESYSENPFKQAICVLGESGAGKSVTIENILENEDHNFEFIIPTAATTGLLAQFSPSKSGYVPSRLGRMLIEASNNPETLYTAVFDEMHKSNVIEMINDELLQAISTKRNKGIRFISLDDDTSEIYSESNLETQRGNLLIPDNFGFIFISSKPRVISNNPDFFNRVDIVILTEEDRDIQSSEELIDLKISEEEKKNLSSSRND